jgi:hypothetical protein
MAARWGRDVKTLRHAWSEFSAKRSPRILGVGIIAAVAARIAYGDLGWPDLVAVAAMLVIYPFGEWAIHVYLLHMPPFEFRGRSVYLATSKSHWAHHKQPNDLGMILLAPIEVGALLLLAVPTAIAIFALPVSLIAGEVPWGAVLTGLLVGYVLVGIYEWTHFLIHTAVRPKTPLYRAVWRTHRLHHFKNEHYWHGITSTFADRALGTFPDHRDVERSRTARTLNTNA